MSFSGWIFPSAYTVEPLSVSLCIALRFSCIIHPLYTCRTDTCTSDLISQSVSSGSIPKTRQIQSQELHTKAFQKISYTNQPQEFLENGAKNKKHEVHDGSVRWKIWFQEGYSRRINHFLQLWEDGTEQEPKQEPKVIKSAQTGPLDIYVALRRMLLFYKLFTICFIVHETSGLLISACVSRLGKMSSSHLLNPSCV